MSQSASDLKVLPACNQTLHVASHFLLCKGVHGEPLRSAFVLFRKIHNACLFIALLSACFLTTVHQSVGAPEYL